MTDPLERLSAFDPISGEGRADAPSYLLIDVFTSTPLEGNALALVTDARGIDPARMQPIAREFNLSETVFALPAQAGGDIHARIFTPWVELAFAGHPVLGTAIALGGALGSERVALETAAGIVEVELGALEGRVGEGRMSQPIPTWEPFEDDAALLAALGVERARLPVEVYVNGPRHVLVALESEQQVAALDPDLGALAALGELGASCFAVSGAHALTRMFAPAMGVPEDPATGSAAGPLAVHLARHGVIAFGEELEIRQGEQIGRPSRLLARVTGSRERIERVEVAGAAVIVARGTLAFAGDL